MPVSISWGYQFLSSVYHAITKAKIVVKNIFFTRRRLLITHNSVAEDSGRGFTESSEKEKTRTDESAGWKALQNRILFIRQGLT